MKNVVATCIAIAGLALAAPAQADDFQHWQIKLGVSGVLPNESASISPIGGNVRISDEYVPSAQVEYFLTPNISAELLCCTARHDVGAVATAVGNVDLGKVSHFPPTVTLKYHWTDFGAIEPYVGAGVNYTHFFSAHLPSGGPVTDIHYRDSFGGALQAGVDYRLNDHWGLNFDVRRIWIHSNVRMHAGPTAISAKTDIDPWVVTSAVSYRF
ncbi:MAG: OmpW family outer membrane protein [Terricaulis sp.]